MTCLQCTRSEWVRVAVLCIVGVLAATALLFRPVHAQPRNVEDMHRVAVGLSNTYRAITFTFTGSPIIEGDLNPVVYRMAPSGQQGFGELFLEGRYNIIYTPNDPGVLGAYLCHLGQEYVRQVRRQNSSFLPKFDVTVGVDYRNVKFEIKGDQDTIAELVYGILSLWDWATKANYGRFKILIRGFADAGPRFSRQMDPSYPMRSVVFLPRAQANQMHLYSPGFRTEPVPDPYTNANLPNMRATHLKQVIDAFLRSCRIDASFSQQSVVLDGAVIDRSNAAHRTIELFFYAHE